MERLGLRPGAFGAALRVLKVAASSSVNLGDCQENLLVAAAE
jgi:hypothetical protein